MVVMTKRIDYQNENGDYEAVQAQRRSEIRAHAQAEHDAFEGNESAFEETAKAIYPNPNPGTVAVDGDVNEQPNAEQKIEEASPAEQQEAIADAEQREAEVHPPIEEPEVDLDVQPEVEPQEEEAPKTEKKETAAQKKAREVKAAK